MKIYRYGICLQRLNIHQTELVRYWRNKSYISRYMEYRGHITEGMQEKWFERINNMNHFFFIINYKETPIGLINTSYIDFEHGLADTGLFVWDESYIGSHIPVLASLCMLDIIFEIFGLSKATAKVKDDNDRAIQYNEALGFKFKTSLKDTGFSLYELDKEHYFSHAINLRKSAALLFGDKTEIHIQEGEDVYEIINNYNLQKKLHQKDILKTIIVTES